MSLEDFLHQSATTLSGGLGLSALLAVAAGVVACSVCPCSVPVGLGLAGLVSTNSERASKRSGLPVAVAFFLGIVVSLTVLGAVAGRLGVILTETFGRYWALAMALISLVAAGIAFYGPYLKPHQLQALRKPGLGGTFGYGFIFSLGTSAAPLLLLLGRPAWGAGCCWPWPLASGGGCRFCWRACLPSRSRPWRSRPAGGAASRW
jgi:cytochrome c-type biogenesis protein